MPICSIVGGSIGIAVGGVISDFVVSRHGKCPIRYCSLLRVPFPLVWDRNMLDPFRQKSKLELNFICSFLLSLKSIVYALLNILSLYMIFFCLWVFFFSLRHQWCHRYSKTLYFKITKSWPCLVGNWSLRNDHYQFDALGEFWVSYGPYDVLGENHGIGIKWKLKFSSILIKRYFRAIQVVKFIMAS